MAIRLLPFVLAASLAVGGCGATADSGRADDPAPEAASAIAEKEEATARSFMVVAANPLAAEAGFEVLRRGGAAIDAAIAVQMVLTLVEPQSSGIGGGAFLLHWDADARRLEAWDGRETAPMAAEPERFLRPDGTPEPFFDAVVGGRSVGVPGVTRMLEAVHREHGKLPWADLFERAIRLAEQGFPVSPRLHTLLLEDEHLPTQDAARAYFYNEDGEPHPVGFMLKNPQLASTMRRIAEDGASALHRGPIARDIVAAVQRHPDDPGDLTLADLAAYEPLRREPVCVRYRVWSVCGMGPPSSGGIAVGQVLKLLERFDLADMAPEGAEVGHLLAEAGRLAFADRNRYVADADFVPVPVDGLLDQGYLAARSLLIDPSRAADDAEPGMPPGAAAQADDAAAELPSTSHISIVDSDGNVVSMTTSIENAFGSRLFVRGFLLNNQLTDFSFVPERDGELVANRVQPGKRPRSSMSPTIAFDAEGEPAVVVGSPGGSRIIGYVARTLVAVLDQGLGPQAAVALPHVVNRDTPQTDVEDESMADELSAMGHDAVVRQMTSGLHVIVRKPDGLLLGGADPRREGVALGR